MFSMHGKIKFIFIAAFILLTAARAAALTVSGRVTDESSSPVSGMVIGIEELSLITETDAEGAFSFEGIVKGRYSLYFSHRDYGTEKTVIKVKRDFYIEHEAVHKVYEAGGNVTAYSMTDKDALKLRITQEDIKTYPMRGPGDSLHLLQALPGVGGGFSLATVPVIRGLDPLYNKYYIDGIPVDYPFHFAGALVPVMTALNEEAVDEAEIIRVDAPVSAGDHLGNIISIRTKTPEKDGAHAKLVLDPVLPLFPAVFVSLVPYPDLSATAYIRRSDIDWMLDVEEADFYFQDYFYKVEYQLFDRHRIALSGSGSRDEFDYDDYEASSGYNANGLTWEFLINRGLFLRTIVSRYNMEQYLSNKRIYEGYAGAYLRIFPEQDRLFQDLAFTRDGFFIKAGYEYIRYKNGCRANVTLNEIADIDYLEGISASATADFPVEGTGRSVFGKWGIKNKTGWADFGIKNEYYGPLDTRSNSWTGEAGLFAGRYASYIKHSMCYAHPDIYYYVGNTDPDFKDAKAVNWAAGTRVQLPKDLSLNTEIYYSRYYDLNPGVIFNVNDEFYKKIIQLHPFSDESEGSTYGAELFLEYSLYGISGWICYSYSRAERKNESGEEFLSCFDQTHVFRLLASREWKGWDWSLIWHQYSSMPYTPVVASTGSEGDYTAVYGDYNSERFGMHSRVDIKASRKWGNVRFYAEVWNVLLRTHNSVFEYFDSSDPYGSGNPETINDLPVFFWLGLELSI